MRSGPGAAYAHAAFGRAGPRRAPRPFVKGSPPALVHSFNGVLLDRRDDAAPCAPAFSGLAFALGLLLGIVLTSAAFAGGLWWRRTRTKRQRVRKRLTIDPYSAPHHIITEATISPPATVVNMMSSTTQLVSAPQSPRLGRASSTRSTATTTRWRSSRSESSLPLPTVLRNAAGMFSPPPTPTPHRQSELVSLFTAGDDSFRPGPRTSFALSAEPSTATDELFPRTPVSAFPRSRVDSAPPLPPIPGRARAGSLHSLARTAVARDSVSSIGSSWSARTRVPAGPPPTPAPTSALPLPPGEEKRWTQLPASPGDEKRWTQPASPLRPLPDSPGAREEEACPVPPPPSDDKRWTQLHAPPPSSPLRPLPHSPAAREEKAFPRSVPPPAYSRPPSSST